MNKFPNEDNLIEIPFDNLFDYEGLPIYQVTPIYTYAEKRGTKLARFLSAYDYKWFIFDGSININKDYKNTKYYTFKDFTE